jgi:hypothetical protein
MELSQVDHWWPVTYDYGLIRAEASLVGSVRARQYAESGTEVDLLRLEEPLAACLSRLEPLQPARTRELYLETTFGWTALYKNGVRGSDPFLPMFQLSRALGVTALRVCATPATALYHAVILEVYDRPEAGGDANGYRRSIAAANDGGRWVFHQSGAPFGFEDVARYGARRIRDRFTPEALEAVLAGLGIPKLTDATLVRDGTSRGVLLSRPLHAHLTQLSLAEAKARF